MLGLDFVCYGIFHSCAESAGLVWALRAAQQDFVRLYGRLPVEQDLSPEASAWIMQPPYLSTDEVANHDQR